MRTWVFAIVIGVPAVARAEPRWSFGWRTTISNEMLPPPWVIAGGQWRWRARPSLSFAIDADGMRGRSHDTGDPIVAESERTVAKAGASVAYHPWHHDWLDTRGFVGVGTAWELAHEKLPVIGWVDAGQALRPYAFVGFAVERLHPMLIHRGFGIGLDVRATALGGDGPMTAAPELGRVAIQASLELNVYVE